MSFFEGFLRFLDSSMEIPTLYGWFHLLWLGIIAIATILLCLWQKRCPVSHHRTVVGITAILVIVLEVLKQINFGFSYDGGITFDYAWYAFPFQFCSTPMYVGLLAFLIKPGKVHDALCAYLATFAVFAGACVMVYPGDVFIDTIFINIQTMVCHGSMIVIGVYLLATGYVKIAHKTILKAACVFAVCVGLAVAMNEIAFVSGLLETDTFNMFYVSRHCDPHLPVYSLVQPLLPFPLDLLVYIIGFSLAAYIILLLAMGIRLLTPKKQTVSV